MARSVQVEALVDSKTLFDVIAKHGSTTEKRLQIDVFALRQSYTTGELNTVCWIPGSTNPADSLTKHVLSESSPLFELMMTNELKTRVKGWAAKKKVTGDVQEKMTSGDGHEVERERGGRTRCWRLQKRTD